MRVQAIARQLLFLALVFSLTVIFILLLKNPSPDDLADVPKYDHKLQSLPVYADTASQDPYTFSESDLYRRVPFSTEGDGVLVFLHMQKTGGTFLGKNLVENLQVDRRCECTREWEGSMVKCPCLSKDGQRHWMFSRYSTGWKCGLHADYTELAECLDAGIMDKLEGFSRPRKYYMMTVLREPVKRYLSEFQHVSSRGASWARSTLRCMGKSPNEHVFPRCYTTDTWQGVTLDDFISCPYNLATNRQTRMLANLTLVGCYDHDLMTSPVKRRKVLESAKENLKSLPYFALMNYLNESQLLFEETFGLRFSQPLYTMKNYHDRNTGDLMRALSQGLIDKVRRVNDLDLQLYSFARQLFLQRYEFFTSHHLIS